MLLPLSLFRLENHVSLSHGVQVAGAACAGSDENRGRSRRPGVEHRGWYVRSVLCTWR
jgi:hypothetical protein